MISGTEMFYVQDTSQYQSPELLDKNTLLNEILGGDHLGVLQWLDAGGSLDDLLGDSYYASIGHHCFKYLSTSQFKEILSKVPTEAGLPCDTLDDLQYYYFEWKLEEIRMLMPELERLNYSFDWIYQRVVEGNLTGWIDFFLDHTPKNLDLNVCTLPIIDFDIHPLARMRFYATQLSIQEKIADRVFGSKHKQVLGAALKRVHATIEKMENHSEIDVDIALEHMEKLRKYYYFEGDLQYERDCAFAVDAMTFNGLEKHVAAGFDLNAPLGPFSIMLLDQIPGDRNTKWIELLTSVYGYKKSHLIDLMEKYRVKGV